MELLVTLSTRRGHFSSSLFTPTKHATLIVRMEESVQDLRYSPNACGLAPVVVKWLDDIRLEESRFLPDTWDNLLQEFAGRIQNANTCGVIWDRGDECIEFTMVFTNMPFNHGGRVYQLSELQTLTKDLTLSLKWS